MKGQGEDPRVWPQKSQLPVARWQLDRWLSKGAARGRAPAVMELQVTALQQVQLFQEEGWSRRVLFWLGAAFKGHLNAALGRLFDQRIEESMLRLAQRCIELYDLCLSHANAAIECWTGVGLRLGVVKDIRLMIAQLAGGEPWAWSGIGNV
jgi:hypothetical protein